MFNDSYKDKTVLVTGHTGFKGSWLSIWLNMMGAKVIGYSLDPYSDRGNFTASHLNNRLLADIRGDIRDFQKLNGVIKQYQPEIIFHLAAQALVKTAYDNPKETYETNLIGSINILESVRQNDFIKTVKAATLSQDNLFPSLLSLLNIQTQVIDPNNNMLHQCAVHS